MKRCFRIFLLSMVPCCMASFAHAQDAIYSASNTDTVATKKVVRVTPVHQAPKGPKPIKHELAFGYRLHTLGWSIYTDIGTVKTANSKLADMFYNVYFWQLEFSEKKNGKQEKSSSDGNSSGNSSNYIYGKINNFYAFKLGYGYRKLLAGKPDPGSVSIHWANSISASLGMLKPYYLNIDGDPNAIKYSEDTKGVFLNQRNILGSAGFGQGLGEMKMIPGGHFKSMLHFDFATNRKSAVAVETGISIDYYSESIKIMAAQEAKPYFVDLFMAFQFGKRW